MICPADIVVLPEKGDKWVLMNVFSRTCLGVDSSGLELLKYVELKGENDACLKFDNQEFSVWNIGFFSNETGLLADPTRYIRDVTKWNGSNLRVQALIEKFKENYLLIEDLEEYRVRFGPKESLLDGKHFGNFHQQLAAHLLLKCRQDPSKWWLKQKFTDDLKAVRNNLYGAIQDKYLKKYFVKKFSGNDRVVDIGCGIGYYTHLMAQTGAKVMGIDPNKEYIDLARNRTESMAEFQAMDVGKAGALDSITSHSVDYVFMSDALLFYFVPLSPDQPTDISVLFNDIQRILKPEGVFISVEPHYTFWLQPWLGEIERPFTILTEYSNRQFSVTASTSQLIQCFNKGGFMVQWMEEMVPDASFENEDPRAYNFGRNFPLWQLFELKKVASNKF